MTNTKKHLVVNYNMNSASDPTLMERIADGLDQVLGYGSYTLDFAHANLCKGDHTVTGLDNDPILPTVTMVINVAMSR